MLISFHEDIDENVVLDPLGLVEKNGSNEGVGWSGSGLFHVSAGLRGRAEDEAGLWDCSGLMPGSGSL